MIEFSASNDDDAGLVRADHTCSNLPLVLITLGDGQEEFETLYDHLEALTFQAKPRYQSLIVAKPEVPTMLYNVLRQRIKPFPHVHLRRLGDIDTECSELRHETGTFLVSHKRAQTGS